MPTLGDALSHAGIDPLAVLDAQIDVPILTGSQRQGDVFVLSCPNRAPAITPIPVGGVVVVAAETSMANRHEIHSWIGTCFYDPDPSGSESDIGLTLGILTVPEGAAACLVHTGEHGANGCGVGTYELRRQREFAGEWRRIAD